MVYKLDEEVIFNNKIMRVWDYSLRSNKYTLVFEKDGVQQECLATEEEINQQLEESISFHAKQIARTIPSANWEFKQLGNGYSIQRDLGKSMVKAYQIGLLYSPEFYNSLIEELRKEVNKRKENNNFFL